MTAIVRAFFLNTIFTLAFTLAPCTAQALETTLVQAGQLLDRPGQAPRGASTVVITDGKTADLIAVTGDPLHDVTVLKSVKFVMKTGRVIKNEE